MNERGLLPIGEVARLFHISVSSLRHYEALGLLTPAFCSPESGYRYYSTEQFEVLNTIRYLRALDMPLAQIRDVLDNRDVGRMEEKLRQQKEAVRRKQEELRRIERKIDHRLAWLRDAQEAPLDVIAPMRLPPVRMAWMDDPLTVNGAADMEAPIRRLDQSGAEAVVFLGKVGLGISREHLAARQTGRYDGIFLVLDEEDVYDGPTMELPAAPCVRLRFRGSHAEAHGRYAELLDYVERQQMQIAGFSRETTLIDYGVTSDTDAFVTEICIPVTRGQ